MSPDMKACLAEFIGTAMLIVFGDGVVANVLLKKSKGENSGWIVIATGWCLAVMMAVYCVGRVSGGHLNPAVTAAMAFSGNFAWAKLPGYVAAQMAGAFVGAVIVWLAYLPHWAETEDQGAKLGVFCTAPGIRNAPGNFICEAIGTAVLIFGVMAIGANAAELTDTAKGIDLSLVFSKGINPMLVGFLIWALGLSLGGPTGYALNPARDLGPRIAHAVLPIAGKGGSDWGYAWIPVVAPIAGGIAGAALFALTGFGVR